MNESFQANQILISGMMRSGTTLLQRALDAHPGVRVAYQSNTTAFIRLKQAFLAEIGLDSYHALTHYNPAQGYNYQDFYQWANERDLLDLLALKPVDGILSGVKEVLVEEFYPLLVDRGVFCMNIVRDPRDVIASMSFGEGFQHAGQPRPVLFDLRNWRKSVHFGHALLENAFFRQIRFEDLLTDTDRTLKGVFQWLSVDPCDVRDIELVMASEGWSGNSSFGDKSGFDSTSINNHVKNLPENVRNYVEAVCWQEMKLLGYPLTIAREDRRHFIENYVDPFPVERKEFHADYSSEMENVRYEVGRVEKTFSELQCELFS